MSSTTTYRCDRCGKQTDKGSDLHTVLMLVMAGHRERPFNYPHIHTSYQDDRAHLDICGKCREELGIGRVVKQGEEPAPPPMTTEQQLCELIRVLAREEAEAASGNG